MTFSLPSARMTLLLFLMLGSGLAGISYEILYGRLFGNMIGDQFIVSAAVLITFLLGIGIGALLAWRVARWLWAIEGLIGLLALLVSANSTTIEQLLYHGWPMAGIGGSLLFCALFLLLPALLIGCSVPLFANLLQQEGMHKRVFATVYGTYNLGAAATALLIEFVLLRHYGISHTITLFASLNIIIAALLFVAFRSQPPSQTKATTGWIQLSRGQWAALLLASVASAAFQLWAIKIAEMVLGPFRDGFAIVLALVLTGLVLGSLAVRRWQLSLTAVLAWAAAGLIVTMLMLEPVMTAYAYIFHLTIDHLLANTLLKIAALTILFLLPVTALGATIPALLQDERQLARDSGQLLFASALANSTGFLLMTLLLHRSLAYGGQMLVIIALMLIALLLACGSKRITTIILAGALAVSAVEVVARNWNENLLYIGYTSFEDHDDLKENLNSFNFADAYRGFQDVFSISWMDHDPYFFINGYISIPLNNPSEKIVGAVSSIFTAQRNHALVLGLGSGATASAVGQFFKQTEVIEINPVVRENLFRMRRWNYDIEHNPKVQIIVDDAIHFLRLNPTPRYDLILNTVTTPLYFSSAKLYSQNFFQDIKKNLNPGGLYVTWIDSRIGDEGADIILRSLQGSFRHSALLYVKSAYFLLICSDAPIHAFHPDMVGNNLQVRNDLWRNHHINANWLQYQLLTTDSYRLIGDPAAPINTLDYPALEFAMSSGRDSGLPKFRKRLLKAMENHALQGAALPDTEWDSGAAIVHGRRLLHKSSIYKKIRDTLGKEQQDVATAWNHALFTKARLNATLLPSAKHWHTLGKRLLKMQQYKQAIDAFRQALLLNPNHRNSHFNIATALEALEKYPEAAQHYQQELAIDTNDSAATYRVARVLVKQRKMDAAEPWFAKAAAMKQALPDSFYYYRGLMHIAQHKRDNAIADLKRALAIHHDDQDILDLLIKLAREK
ncbi:MAG: tetratricopeptide repeat protein [Mariprofundales bacterium]